MELTKRILNLLSVYLVPDEERDAFWLLAEHVQRLDELVAIQWQKDVCANDYSLPNDVLDGLWARQNELRKAIWDETPLRLEDGIQQPPEQADEEGVGPYKLHADVAALRGRGVVSEEDLDAANERIRELEAQLETANANYREMHDAWLERNDTIRKMDKRNRELEAELAEHRRMSSHVATVMRREEALKKRVEELEHEKYVGQVKGWADEYERDADAEVGRAIRGLRPRKGHISVTLTVTVIDDAVSLARVTWEELYRAAGGATACYHGRGCVIPAIAEYIKEEG